MESAMLDLFFEVGTSRCPPGPAVIAAFLGDQGRACTCSLHSFLAIAAATESLCHQVVS
jgi:hypothetical protein